MINCHPYCLSFFTSRAKDNIQNSIHSLIDLTLPYLLLILKEFMLVKRPVIRIPTFLAHLFVCSIKSTLQGGMSQACVWYRKLVSGAHHIFSTS